MWHRPSPGTRSVDRRTSLAQWLHSSRCHTHTSPSHCRSCHQVFCSGAEMTLWTADKHHPPGWEKRKSVVTQLWRLLRLRVKCAAIRVLKYKTTTAGWKYLIQTWHLLWCWWIEVSYYYHVNIFCSFHQIFLSICEYFSAKSEGEKIVEWMWVNHKPGCHLNHSHSLSTPYKTDYNSTASRELQS